MTGMTLELQYF